MRNSYIPIYGDPGSGGAPSRKGWAGWKPIVIAAALFLPGCAVLEGVVGEYAGESGLALLNQAQDGVEKIEDATLGNAAKAMSGYCENVPLAARKALRNAINSRHEAKGATIVITCPQDE